MASGSAQRWTSKLASQISVAGGGTSSFVKQHGEIGDGRSQQCSNSDIGGCLLTFKLSFSWSNGLGLWWNLGSLFLSRYGLIGGDLQRSCETCLECWWSWVVLLLGLYKWSKWLDVSCLAWKEFTMMLDWQWLKEKQILGCWNFDWLNWALIPSWCRTS